MIVLSESFISGSLEVVLRRSSCRWSPSAARRVKQLKCVHFVAGTAAAAVYLPEPGGEAAGEPEQEAGG